MHVRHSLPLLLFLSLMVPQAWAAGLTATRIDVLGKAEADGVLDRLVLLTGMEGNPDAIFLWVSDGVLEIDQETTDVWAGGIGVTPVEQHRDNRRLSNTTIHSFALDDICQIIAVPLDGETSVQSSLAAAVYKPSDMKVQSYPPLAAYDRDPVEISGKGATEMQAQSGLLRLQAPLRIQVWGANFVVEEAGSAQAIATGKWVEPIAGAGGLGASKRIEREAFIYVHEGFVTFSLNPRHQILLSTVGVDLRQGELRILEPKGQVPVDGSAVPMGSRILQLPAPFSAGISAPDTDTLTLTFPTPPREAVLDGVLIQAEPSFGAWPYALLLALVAIPLAATAVSRARLAARLRALDGHIRSRRFGPALEVARGIRRRRPLEPDALVAETLALLHYQRHSQAISLLRGLGWTAALQPMREYLWANAEAGQGKTESAVAHLGNCLRLAPEMALHAGADPLLVGLLPRAARKTRGVS